MVSRIYKTNLYTTYKYNCEQCIDPPCSVKCSGQGGGFVSCSPKYIIKKNTFISWLKAGPVVSCLCRIGCAKFHITRGMGRKSPAVNPSWLFSPHKKFKIPTSHVWWPAKFRETKFCEMFREIFISHFAKFSNDFREISRNEIYENFAKVIWQNCTETNFVSFLLLNSYRNLNFNSIFHYFVNKLCCEDKFFRNSHFKGTVVTRFFTLVTASHSTIPL
jgi:hypothetical protein